MSTQTTTFSTAGSNAYTAPSTLLNGSVTATVDGCPGAAAASGGAGGKGAQVVGVISIAAGGALTCIVGDTGTNGQHTGGAGGVAAGGSAGGHGGGSSAVIQSATLMIEAGGGGGGGGWGGNSSSQGGAGGGGGLSPGNGANGAAVVAGTQQDGGGGGGGGGNTGNGGAAAAPNTSAGGTAPGGGGNAGIININPNFAWGGGGGGAGGKSFAAAGVSGVTYSDGVSTSAYVTIQATVADPPLAPTLGSPANGSYLDSNGAGVTFTWTYNPGTDSGTQTAYALRVSTDGGAYQYWNAGTSAFQSSIVWNSLTTFSVAIPAGKLADAHSYTWSIATQESHYGLQGPFASDSQFTATAIPTATITSPPSTTSSPTPTVAWSETLGSGDVQTAYRVVIYTQAATLAAGFSAGSTAGTVDSGTVSSATTSYAVPTPLAQGTWVVYVQITETGGVTSQWASATFTVAYDAPAAPSLTAVGSTSSAGVPTVTLTATAHDNLLSYNDASFEAGVGDWTPGANATLAQSSAQALDGNSSMSVTAAASGGPFTLTPSTSGSPAVNTGQQYAAMASLRAAATGRSWTLGIQWKNSSGTILSTTTGSAVTDTTTGWTQVSVTGTAPANAVKADLILTGTAIANSEVHYVDNVGLFQSASVPTWTRGGLIGIELMTFQRSTDGGTTWTNVRNGVNVAVPTNTEQVQVIDYEAPFNTTCTYQAIVSANVTQPTTATIASSAGTATVTTPAERWFITDPLDTSISLSPARVRLSMGSVPTSLQVPTSIEFDSTERMGIFYGWGNPSPIVQRGTVQNKTFTAAFYIEGMANYKTWLTLVGRDGSATPRQHTLQLRDDMGNSWYVIIGPNLADQLLRTTDRLTNPKWAVVAPCLVVSAP